MIHSDGYSWEYVDRLYSMLTKNLSWPVKLHVFTEPSRAVPPHFIRHDLVEWPGLSGPKKSWWYKIQMFNSNHYSGNLLYFDLDIVIAQNIDWIVSHDTRYFWAVKDFKCIWRPDWQGINSSVMYWNTKKHHSVWEKFSSMNLQDTVAKYHGDQDFLNSIIDPANRRFFNQDYIKSWRWQVFNGGMNMSTRKYHNPGKGAVIDPNTKIIVFHGKPKPHEIDDQTILYHWC